MRKKLPYIILAVALVVSMVIVIKGIASKKATESQYREYADKVDTSATDQALKSSDSFEYIQTNPESGLAIIYTFKISEENDSVTSGLITIDGDGSYMNISCAVTEEADSTVFIFSKLHKDSRDSIDAKPGDVLVRLHKKDGRVIPEWVKLQPVIKGEPVIANF